MQNLLNFLRKYNYWLLFILLETAGFTFLFRFNNYQHSVFFTSANAVAGYLYSLSGGIASYFNLKAVNNELLDQNISLLRRVNELEDTLRGQAENNLPVTSMTDVPGDEFTMLPAQVIKNSIHHKDNYITLNKGTSDGVRSDMGVVDRNGVVGIVYAASPSFSVVISLLNSKSNISCKVKRSNYFGYLKWQEGDPTHAFLEDLPRHAEFALGDTIVTSGYSAIFPPGIVVGTISNIADSSDGLSYMLKIKLAVDFGKLSQVRVIERDKQEEQHTLEGKEIK